MDFFVEERLDDGLVESKDPRIHAIAGGCAGVMEHCGMFPLDTVKTHQQLLNSPSIGRTVRTIIQKNGLMGLFRGLPVVAGGAAPVHSISFTVYEFTKRLTNANQTGTHQKLAEGFSGAVATLSHDACMSPIDTVKQRLQFGGRPYRGVVDCVTQLWRTEGLVVFYRGFTTTATMNLPYGTVYYGSYESMKRMIKSGIGHENQRNDPLTHMLAGACGGAMAGAVTTPLDIIRTKLQVGSDAGGVRYSGMVKTTRQIWEAERWRGFVKGLRARVLFHSMSAAISWTTYEYMKFLLETIFLEQQQQQQQQQLRNSTVEAEGSTRRD